jgi:hypothetical protein
MAKKKTKRKDPKRVAAGRKAARTRKRRQRAEFKRRSIASKKGWRRRRGKARIKEAAKKKPIRKGKLREFIVTWSYAGKASQRNRGSTSRQIGFGVIARNPGDAGIFVVRAVADGTDSAGADLTWMDQVPWTETDVTEPEQQDENALDRKTIKSLGEGWVEVR